MTLADPQPPMGLGDADPHVTLTGARRWPEWGLRTPAYLHQLPPPSNSRAQRRRVEHRDRDREWAELRYDACVSSGYGVLNRAKARNRAAVRAGSGGSKISSAVTDREAMNSDPATLAVLVELSAHFIFIDEDHSYAPCRPEFKVARDTEARLIAFGDIVDAGCTRCAAHRHSQRLAPTRVHRIHFAIPRRDRSAPHHACRAPDYDRTAAMWQDRHPSSPE